MELPKLMEDLWNLVRFRSRTATFIFVVCAGPLLVLALLLAPSPMTPMKAELYSVIIPASLVFTVLACLVEWAQVGRRRTWMRDYGTGTGDRQRAVDRPPRAAGRHLPHGRLVGQDVPPAPSFLEDQDLGER